MPNTIQELANHFTQQNMLMAHALKNKQTPDQVVGDNQSNMTMDKTEAANQAAQQQDVGDHATETAKEFPQQLQGTNQAIENETGVPTGPQANWYDQIGREPANALTSPELDTNILPTNTEQAQKTPNQANVVPMQRPGLIENPPVNIPKVPGTGTTVAPTEKENIASVQKLQKSSENEAAGIPAMYESEVAALKAKRGADVEALTEEQLQTEAKLKSQKDFALSIQQKVNDANVKLDSEMGQMLNVDPGRVWNNNSTAGKFAFLVSAAFGGLAPGGALNTLITNDIAAQVQDIKTHGAKASNLVSIMEKYTGNLMDASKMAYDYQNKLFELQVKQKQAGANLQDEVIKRDALQAIIPYWKDVTANRIAVMGKAFEGQKLQTEARQNDIKNKLEAAGIKLKTSELEFKLGTPSEADMTKIPQNVKMFESANDMQRLEKEGLDPTSAAYRSFVSSRVNPGLMKEGVTTLLAKISPSDMSKFEQHYNATREYLKNEKLSAPGGRTMTEQQLSTYADGQMAKMFSTPETVRKLQIDRLKNINANFSGFSPGGRNFLKHNFLKDSPVIYQPK